MRIQSPTFFRFSFFIVAICIALPLHAGTRCGLVDGVTDGSTDADTDRDGIPDCLDEYSWPAQLGAESYQVARTSSPGLPGVCIPTSNTFLVDLNQPGPGGVLIYLNRPIEPHLGSWGQDSARRERGVPCGLSR